MTFSPSSPPTPAMFGLDVPWPLSPAPAAVDWSAELDAYGEPGSGLGQMVQGLDDVEQCIIIILTTPKGSDPLRPTFACDVWQYVDRPIDLALPEIVREVFDAIETWEKRVNLQSVTAQQINPSDNQGAHLDVVLVWSLAIPQAPSVTTTVSIPSPSGFATTAGGA